MRRLVWTDGADTSQRAAGVGVYFGPDHAWNVSRRVFGSADTNNRAELEAVLDAVWFISRVRAGSDPASEWEVRTDSRFARDCVTTWWMSWYRRSGRKPDGAAAIHYSLSVRIARVLHECGPGVHIVWIPRHENSGADALAKEGKAKDRVCAVPRGHPLCDDLAEGPALTPSDEEWAAQRVPVASRPIAPPLLGPPRLTRRVGASAPRSSSPSRVPLSEASAPAPAQSPSRPSAKRARTTGC